MPSSPTLEAVDMQDGFQVHHKAIVKSERQIAGLDVAYVVFHFTNASNPKKPLPPSIVVREHRFDPAQSQWVQFGALLFDDEATWKQVAAAILAVTTTGATDEPAPIASLAKVEVEHRTSRARRFIKQNDKRAIGVFLLEDNGNGQGGEVYVRTLKKQTGGWGNAGGQSFPDKAAAEVATAVASWLR